MSEDERLSPATVLTVKGHLTFSKVEPEEVDRARFLLEKLNERDRQVYGRYRNGREGTVERR